VVALLAVLLGAGLVVLATGRDWVTLTVAAPGGSIPVHADGRLAAPGAVALALVAVAGIVVAVTAGRVVRTVVAGLLLLAGLAVAALTVPVWRAPADAARPAVARVTGTIGGTGTAGRDGASAARPTPWPLVSAAGGLLIAAGGLAGVIRGGGWPGPSRRFERPAGSIPGGPEPTGGDPGQPAVAAPSGSVVAGSVVAGSVEWERDRRLDAWDSLSRGEDPTADAGPADE
jgi:uncharacterized membrane protein (TIGR02234 family)